MCRAGTTWGANEIFFCAGVLALAWSFVEYAAQVCLLQHIRKRIASTTQCLPLLNAGIPTAKPAYAAWHFICSKKGKPFCYSQRNLR